MHSTWFESNQSIIITRKTSENSQVKIFSVFLCVSVAIKKLHHEKNVLTRPDDRNMSSKYLYFPGCKIPSFLPQYDRSIRVVLNRFAIELDDTELNCCGYPVRHRQMTAAVLSAARILAIAARKNLPIMTPCKCCFGNMKYAAYWLRKNEELRRQVNRLLQDENLFWTAGVQVRHLLSVLAEDVGIKRLQKSVDNPLVGIKVAAHYGCHALRSGNVTRFDNPLAPTIFENLIAATGATAVEWPLRLECCGHPVWEKNNQLSLNLMNRKLNDAKAAGAEVLATACTYCQMQFDAVRKGNLAAEKLHESLPAVLYPQLLGLAMGIDRSELGLDENYIPW